MLAGALPSPAVPTDVLEAMLTRLRLQAIRERLVGAAFSEGVALLEAAARREMNLREGLAGHPTNSGTKALRNLWG